MSKLFLFFALTLLFSCKVDTPIGSNTNATVNSRNFSYSVAEAKYVIGEAIVAPTPQMADVGNFTYSVSPTLPAGIVFNPSNGSFSGTPTVLSPAIDYTFKANLDTVGVEYKFVINIQVTEAAPTAINYPSATLNSVFTYPIVPLVPIVAGTVNYFTIEPSLPAGLTMNTSTGVISGTPAIPSYEALHFISAHNSGGEIGTTLNVKITPTPPPASLFYSAGSYTCYVGIACLVAGPTVIPGAATGLSFSISPNLPAGYIFNTTNGSFLKPAITNNLPSPNTVYTVTVSNPYGFATTTFNLETILDAPVSLNYPATTNVIKDLVIGSAIAPAPLPISAPISSYTLLSVLPPTGPATNALPSGLNFNNLTGEIYGIPNSQAGTYAFTIRGSNLSGFIDETFNIVISEQLITGLNYPTFPAYLTKNNVIYNDYGNSPNIYLPSYTGSEATSFNFVRFDDSMTSLGATLPAGLIWNSERGNIYGTPTEIVTYHTIRVWAVNGAGTSAPFDFYLSVSDVAPVSISYPQASYTLTMCTDVNIPATLTGGTPSSISIFPGISSPGEFPATAESTGLTLNPDGSITGNVSQHYPTTHNYTVNASNLAGGVFTNIAINTLPDAPNFTINHFYPTSGVGLTHPTQMISCYDQSTPTITPSLPTEFSLDPTNNIIYSGYLGGTQPTSLVALKNYSLELSNVSGNQTKNFEMDLSFRLSSAKDKGQTVVADFDLDGVNDIIVTEADCPIYGTGPCSQGYISILKQKNTNGEYYKAYGSTVGFNNFSYIKVQDMNDDLYPDIVFYDEDTNTIAIYQNNLGNSFSYLESTVLSAPASHIIYQGQDIFVADGQLSGGLPYIKAIHFDESLFSFTTSLHTIYYIPAITSFTLATVDNTDTFKDLVILDTSDNSLCSVLSITANTFQNTCAYKRSLTAIGAKEIYSAKYGADTHDEIIVVNDDSASSISIVENNGSLLATGTIVNSSTLPDFADPKSIVISDINNDNTLDFILKITDGVESDLYFYNGLNIAAAPNTTHHFHTTSVTATELSGGVDSLITCHEFSGVGYCRILNGEFNPYSF